MSDEREAAIRAHDHLVEEYYETENRELLERIATLELYLIATEPV